MTSAYTYDNCLTYEYDAWGEQLTTGTQAWGASNPIRYNGQYYDTESAMTYLRARYYDSGVRRFISEDPIKDGVNWYAYAGNNPVMFVDPSGLELLLQYDDGNIIDYLNKLSDDYIYIKNGEIKYDETGNNQYPTATSLIRRIIDDDRKCVIVLNDSVKTETGYDEYVDYLGETVNSVVHFYTGNTDGVTLFDGTKENDGFTIKMMELAHELIHSLRNFGGNNKSGQMVNGNIYNGETQFASAEEFETIGINYKTSGGQFVETTKWVTTENKIRSERGLRWRGKAY